MSDREEALGALRASAGGIDPVLDQAEGYARAVKEVQKLTRTQGQVMSATLENNAMLWEERKQLRAQNRELLAQNARISQANEQIGLRNAELQKTLEQYQSAGGDHYKVLYEQARATLTNFLSDALDQDQLGARLAEMQAQQLELEADGVGRPKAPWSELDAGTRAGLERAANSGTFTDS